MENPRVIGHVASVSGFRVKVELLQEARSPSRATLDGVQTAVAINAYLTFTIGAGLSIIGMITDLEARESYDPSSGDELSLELLKARRVAIVQLLGTVERTGTDWTFNPGITILPTLDAPAEIGSPKMLEAVFERPPKKNKPDDCESDDFDFDLVLGFPTGQKENKVKASYNDLFSRPLAIVGNTGSGKSYSVASILKKAINEIGESEVNAPHVFILDINGEYARSFLPESAANISRFPDHIYLNGKEFGIPLWFFNSQEICAWLSAAEQTQEPVLKDWWSIAKNSNAVTSVSSNSNMLRGALMSIEVLLEELPKIKRKSVRSYFNAIKGFLSGTEINTDVLEAQIRIHDNVDQYNSEIVSNQNLIQAQSIILKENIKLNISQDIDSATDAANTADTPLYISRTDLIDPSLVNRSVSQQDSNRIDAHLTTLKLRLKTRLDDKRWKSFLNYERQETNYSTLEDWLKQFGFLEAASQRVSIIDLSMLSHEALPYACSVIGRILLESRERLPANQRYEHPWVLVLEEAHNYARPTRQSEERGQTLSRMAFERIAKEGRKFGLSLIVASQRPSEISPTIISQCANFISHRLQNPDDIDHFRRIIPMQARRLLDQVTVLASGEAIVFGSAFHIPTRVQIDIPNPPPWSQTAAPYHEWKSNKTHFPIDTVLINWGLKQIEQETAAPLQYSPNQHDDETDVALTSETPPNDDDDF